jgi:hypothetical protein
MEGIRRKGYATIDPEAREGSLNSSKESWVTFLSYYMADSSAIGYLI